VAAVALLLSGWGVAARDLAGDEQNMLHGTPAQILSWSLDPRGGFVGHLPLSFWARWASLAVFSEIPAWAWRLHAVLFTVLAAALTTTTAARHFGQGAALIAGLLFVCDPIGAFHAQEASNYAASALTGVLLIRGLLDLSARDHRGAGWLAAGLFMGAANDFYSVLLAGPALVVSLICARRAPSRRALAVAWLVPLVAVTPFALLFALRLWDSTGSGVLEVHADPLPPRPLPAVPDAFWRVARRFFGAHLHGYAGGRNDALWVGLPPVLFGLTGLMCSLRGRAWPAAVMVLGALLLHGLLGVGLQLGSDRILPYEPRSLIGGTGPLAIALASLVCRPQPWLRWAVPIIWLLAAGTSTLEARLNPAPLRARAISHARALTTTHSLVIPEDRTRARAPEAVACIPAHASAAVVITNHTSTEPAPCGAAPELPLVHRTFFDAPVHEGSAASFLPRRVVSAYGVGPEAAPLRVERAFLDGLSHTTWTHLDERGSTLARGDDPGTFQPTSGFSRISASPTAPPWLPDHPLFLAHRNAVQTWELDPLDRQPVLHATALRAPWLTTLRGLLPILGILLGLCIRRQQP